MQRLALCAALLSVAAAPTLLAQGDPPIGSQPAQQPSAQQAPRDLMVAPSPAEKTPEVKASNPGTPQSARAPASMCAELVAFFEKKDAQPATKSDTTKSTGGSQPDTKTAGPGQTAPPMDHVQQRSGLSAPVPQDDKTTGGTQVTLEQAQKLAQSNDLRGCQGAARQMRRAGMALPAGLLVLAALREDLLDKGQHSAGQKTTPP